MDRHTGRRPGKRRPVVASVHTRHIGRCQVRLAWRSCGSVAQVGQIARRRLRTPAPRASNGTPRIGPGCGRLCSTAARESSGQYILSLTAPAPCPTTFLPQLIHARRHAGHNMHRRPHPGCMKRSDGACRSVCSGYACDPRPGSTGSRCAADWRRTLRWRGGMTQRHAGSQTPNPSGPAPRNPRCASRGGSPVAGWALRTASGYRRMAR